MWLFSLYIIKEVSGRLQVSAFKRELFMVGVLKKQAKENYVQVLGSPFIQSTACEKQLHPFSFISHSKVSPKSLPRHSFMLRKENLIRHS